MNGMTPAKKLGATIGATAAFTMLLAGGAMAAEDHLGNTDCRVPTAADDARLYTPGTNAGVAYENGRICDGAADTTATTSAADATAPAPATDTLTEENAPAAPAPTTPTTDPAPATGTLDPAEDAPDPEAPADPAPVTPGNPTPADPPAVTPADPTTGETTPATPSTETPGSENPKPSGESDSPVAPKPDTNETTPVRLVGLLRIQNRLRPPATTRATPLRGQTSQPQRDRSPIRPQRLVEPPRPLAQVTRLLLQTQPLLVK